MKNHDGKDKMNEKSDKQIDAIAKIISLTRKNDIEWQPISDDQLPKTHNDDIIDSAYLTIYKGKPLRVYRRRYKLSPASTSINVAIVRALHSKDGWMSEIILDITNNEGQSLWEFPKEQILSDLLKVIKYKTSGAEDVINSLLEE